MQRLKHTLPLRLLSPSASSPCPRCAWEPSRSTSAESLRRGGSTSTRTSRWLHCRTRERGHEIAIYRRSDSDQFDGYSSILSRAGHQHRVQARDARTAPRRSTTKKSIRSAQITCFVVINLLVNFVLLVYSCMSTTRATQPPPPPPSTLLRRSRKQSPPSCRWWPHRSPPASPTAPPVRPRTQSLQSR